MVEKRRAAHPRPDLGRVPRTGQQRSGAAALPGDHREAAWRRRGGAAKAAEASRRAHDGPLNWARLLSGVTPCWSVFFGKPTGKLESKTGTIQWLVHRLAAIVYATLRHRYMCRHTCRQAGGQTDIQTDKEREAGMDILSRLLERRTTLVSH